MELGSYFLVPLGGLFFLFFLGSFLASLSDDADPGVRVAGAPLVVLGSGLCYLVVGVVARVASSAPASGLATYEGVFTDPNGTGAYSAFSSPTTSASSAGPSARRW
jgi:hypothetical protein